MLDVILLSFISNFENIQIVLRPVLDTYLKLSIESNFIICGFFQFFQYIHHYLKKLYSLCSS